MRIAETLVRLTGQGPVASPRPRHEAISSRSVGQVLLGPIRREPILWLMVAAAAAAYAIFSIVLYDHFGEGYDLGIFDQTVWHYSHFQIPASSLKPLANIWADHFSPILALLAPLFWIWDDARALLLAQALLLAGAGVPIFLIVRDRLGRLPAYLLTASYLIFWGVQTAVVSDFHELAFAPLVMALVLLAADRARWGWYWVAVVALLCVKEDFSLFVIFLGLYLMTMRQWRRGAVTIALGIVWYVLVIKLLMPGLSPKGNYAHWTYGLFGSDAPSAAFKALTHPGLVVSTFFGNGTKRHTLEYLFVPFLFLPLFSRAILLLIPLLAERFLANFTHLWVTDYYYNLQVIAVLVIGSAYGIENLMWLARKAKVRLTKRVETVAVLVLAGAVLALNISFASGFPLKEVFQGSFYTAPSYAAGAARAVALVPAGVSVATQDTLVPHLSGREVVGEITPHTAATDYAIANVLSSYGLDGMNHGFAGVSRWVDLHLHQYRPVGYFDGWLALEKKGVRPQLPRTEALGVHNPAAGAHLWRVYGVWLHSFLDYGRRVTACGANRGCYAGLGARARVEAQELLGALKAIRPALTPGCQQLLGPASVTATMIPDLVNRIRQAGAAGDQQGVAAAEARLRDFTVGRDRGGFLTRFAALCHTGV